MTKSQVKNNVKTGLIEVVDPFTDKQKDMVWDYFDSHCCFCGIKLVRKERKGHMDHLVSKNDGGLNHISNRVLACDKCNGDDKREKTWNDFLKEVSKDEYDKRFKAINDWQGQNKLTKEEYEKISSLRAKAEEIAEVLQDNVEEAFERIREIRDAHK